MKRTPQSGMSPPSGDSFLSRAARVLAAVFEIVTALSVLLFSAAAVYGDIGLFVPKGQPAHSASDFLVLVLASSAMTWFLSRLRGVADGRTQPPVRTASAGESRLVNWSLAAVVAGLWIHSCYLSMLPLLDGARAAFPPVCANGMVYAGALLTVAAARFGLLRSTGQLASLVAALFCASAPLAGYVSVEEGAAFGAAGLLWWLIIALGRVRRDRRRDVLLASFAVAVAVATAWMFDVLHLGWTWEALRLRFAESVISDPWLGLIAAAGLFALWRDRGQANSERTGALVLFVLGCALAGVRRERSLADAGVVFMAPFAGVALGLGARSLWRLPPVRGSVLFRNVAILTIFGLLATNARGLLGRGPVPPEYAGRYHQWREAAMPADAER